MREESFRYNQDSSYSYSVIKKFSYLIISLLSLILLLGVCFYSLAHFLFVFHDSAFSIVDTVFSVMLLGSIFFWTVHCVGYIDHLLKSLLTYRSQINNDPPIDEQMQPKVAVFIPVLNEKPEIVETIIVASTRIKYGNFEVFLLDDSTEYEIQKKLRELAKKFNICYIHRENRRGYKAGAINDAIKKQEQDTQYLLILDVDQCPKSNILNELIPLLEEDATLTFIQTPQYFTNKTKNKLSIAYSFQQYVFHKHVCRGLNINNTVFACGTNVIFRLEHLKKIGGMDETCITEDIATSFILHFNGYKSLYVDKVCAEGIPPPSLSAYFTQQMRWAYGTNQNLKKVLTAFLKSPRRLKLVQWWEYLILNGTWYFSGWTLLICLIYPITVLLFGVKPLPLASNNLPFLTFVVAVGSQIFTSMSERRYRMRDLFLAQGLFFNLFPIYIRASIYAFVGKKLDFRVTLKRRVKAISVAQLCPQLIILTLLIISTVVGTLRILTEQNPITYINIISCQFVYIALILVFIFCFYVEDIKRVKMYEQTKE